MPRRGENIYKRKDGRYEGRYLKSYSIDGKAIYGSIYSRSYADIKNKLTALKAEQKKPSSATGITLANWMNNWLESAPDIKETTKNIYRGHINNHINPRIGKIRLHKLNSDILQMFVSSLDLSPSTVKVVFTVLKSALKAAEERGYISDIWSKIKLPKKTKTEVCILSLTEQKRLETALSDENDIGILISLYTGIRIGELRALKWCDIDFERRVLHINGTQARVDEGIKILPPKSKTSVRSVPLPDFIADKLKSKGRDGEFVLSDNGSFVDVRTYRRRFKRILKNSGLPDIKFHALRHTFATRALEVGMDFKTLSEILGHSTVSITLDLYVHSMDEYKKGQINKLGEIYSPSK
ncbi:MAG: site-specific integrase [Oscillospiraceae bacterium]|nr:site-specific integrase [Oscillospiraceae bacterium]